MKEKSENLFNLFLQYLKISSANFLLSYYDLFPAKRVNRLQKFVIFAENLFVKKNSKILGGKKRKFNDKKYDREIDELSEKRIPKDFLRN